MRRRVGAVRIGVVFLLLVVATSSGLAVLSAVEGSSGATSTTPALPGGSAGGLPNEQVILAGNSSFVITSSLDCLAGHYSANFTVDYARSLSGAFNSTAGVTMYVATAQEAALTSEGHPSAWVYSTGQTNSTGFSVPLSPGTYVVWFEGSDQGCGGGVVAPLEWLTTVNITTAFVLGSQP